MNTSIELLQLCRSLPLFILRRHSINVINQTQLHLLQQPLLQIQLKWISKTTPKISTQAPPVTATENIDQAENVMVDEDEFINIFSTLVYEVGESSSRHVDRDHPLEQVIGNPSQPVRIRRQLETNGEMCMFALTVSRTEPKNIKEAMADHAWIEAMQEELHQFERLGVRELVDIPLCKNVTNMKWLWKNKRNEENTVICNKTHLVAKGYSQKELILKTTTFKEDLGALNTTGLAVERISNMWSVKVGSSDEGVLYSLEWEGTCAPMDIPKGVSQSPVIPSAGIEKETLECLRALAEYQNYARHSLYMFGDLKSNLIACVEEDVFKIEANLFCSNKGLFLLWRILFLVFHLNVVRVLRV
ncbi:hypothetical protein Tco_0117944 [Tanacetum coccineum]